MEDLIVFIIYILGVFFLIFIAVSEWARGAGIIIVPLLAWIVIGVFQFLE
jgi:hypothetical protein